MSPTKLTSFIIDADMPSVHLTELADAIDQHGLQLGLSLVRLLLPEIRQPTRDDPDYVRRADQVRLFTSNDGHFHGTHHNLKNHLTATRLCGDLELTVNNGQVETVYLVTMRPSSEYAPRKDVVLTKSKKLKPTLVSNFIKSLETLHQVPAASIVLAVPESNADPFLQECLALLERLSPKRPDRDDSSGPAAYAPA